MAYTLFFECLRIRTRQKPRTCSPGAPVVTLLSNQLTAIKPARRHCKTFTLPSARVPYGGHSAKCGFFCRVFSVGHSAKQPLTIISPASTFILPSAFFALGKNFAECSINGTRQKYFRHQFSIVFGKIFAGCNMNFAEFFGHLAKRRNSIVDDQPHLLPLLSPYSRTQCARIVTTPVEYREIYS